MTLFITVAILITLVALSLLIWPLFRARNTVSFERHAQNIHYAKERLEELEAQLKNATISATDYEALKLEIESTLADDIDLSNQQLATDQQARPAKTSNKVLSALLICLIPLGALGGYFALGTPEAFELAKQQSTQPSQQDINALVQDIEARLVDNPNDAKGWAVLSRTYLSLGRYQEAKQGFLTLMSLEGESANVLASLADATGLLAQGEMRGEPLNYALRALKLEPNHAQGLWLAGLAYAQANEPEKARQHWNTLLPQLASNPQQQEELRAIIQQTFDQEPQQQQAAKPSGLTVLVSVSPDILNKVDSSTTVFVFAKAQQGPPAPLAVKRFTVGDLPATVRLSDADAMMTQLALSKFEDIVVNARISLSGNPVAQSGDYESTAINSKNDNPETLELSINLLVE